eukprot:TRINITY_DN5538_c1_g1_i2.p1 TRINITY_DN5538_c1_g1~~TRINITY_DN5538_c1_g1_i2.p1  ORF type:complete len:408 (-),score=92.88 TRINITY_DN5538_c1_g1_i2:51-1274(-)
MADSAVQNDIRTLASHLDLIEDVIGQPGAGGEDHASMVNDLLGECGQVRQRLEDAVLIVLEQEDSRSFDQISAVLERLERIQEQIRSGTGGGGSHRASASPPTASRQLPAQTIPQEPSWQDQELSRRPSGADFGHAGGSELASHAASSGSDAFGQIARQSSGLSDMHSSKKKKKEKKDKRGGESAPEEFGFPSNSAGFGSGGNNSLWPAASSSADAFGSGGAAGDAGGGFDMGGWGSGTGAFGDDGGGGGGWGGDFDAAPPASGSSGGGAGANASAFGATASPSGFGAPAPSAFETAFGEEPRPAQSQGSPHVGTGTSGFFGSTAEVDAMPAAETAPGRFSGFGSGSFGGGFGSRGQEATFHIKGVPFAEVEHDREAFERLFVRAAARAAGVPHHRIRVNAIRAGHS